MAEINPPLYLDQDDAYGADELGLPYRDIMGEGIVGSTDLAVTANTGLKSSVAAGAAWIKGDDDANAQPTYRVRNDAAVLIQHDAADPTNGRIDLVIAEVLDSTFSGASKLWRLRAVKGTPSGSPAVPATPNNAIALATVAIAAGSGTLGTITDVRTRAKVGGGAALGNTQVTEIVVGASLPSSPNHLDLLIVRDSSTNPTYEWQFRYNANSTSPYKWEYVGGTDAAFFPANASSSAGSGVAQSKGTIFTTPYAGDWMISGCGIQSGNASASTSDYFVMEGGGSAITLAIAWNATGSATAMSTKRNGIAAGTVYSGSFVDNDATRRNQIQGISVVFRPFRIG